MSDIPAGAGPQAPAIAPPGKSSKGDKVRVMRMLSISAIGLFVAIALIGATSAAAATGTYLCKAKETSCLAKNRYLPPLLFTAQTQAGAEAKIVTSSGTVACKKSWLEGEMTEEGATATGFMAAFGFETCTLEAKACTVTAVHLSYLDSFKATSAGNGTFALKKNVVGKPGVSLVCGETLSCTFVMEPETLPFTGGTPATIKDEAVKMTKESGTKCPKSEEATFTATYATTSPEAVFLANEARTVLCKANEETCAAGNVYAEKTTVESSLEAATEATFVMGAVTTKCKTSTLKTKSAAKEGQPLAMELTAATFGTCSGGCTVELTKVGSTVLRASGAGNGQLSLVNPEFKVNCGSACTFTKSAVVLDVFGGNPNAKVEAKEEALAKETGTCEGPLKWSGKYTVSAPTPLFVAG